MAPVNGTLQAEETQHTMSRIVISGYYGFANLGDEAILAAIVDQIRQQAPDSEIWVLSQRPAWTETQHGVKAVPRMDLWQIWQLLKTSDLFISGGGGLLQDTTSGRSVLYYLGLLEMAKHAGTKTMVFAQGIGPLKRPWCRRWTGKVLSQVDRITVRDDPSRDDLTQMGVRGVEVTADPVLALGHKPGRPYSELVRTAGLDPEQPVVAVALRPWSGWYERQKKGLSSVLAQLAQSEGWQILMLPFQHSKDKTISEETATYISCRSRPPRVGVLHSPLTPHEMADLLGGCEMVVGMRLHALIMAASRRVPAMGLVYDPKVARFCEQAGFPTVASVADLADAPSFAAVLEQVWRGRHQMRQDLALRLPPLEKLAQRNAEVAVSLIGEAP